MTEILEATQSAVRRFRTNWTGTPLTRVLVENQDNSDVDLQDEPWVRITVRQTGGGLETLAPIGSRKYRRRASVFIQIYTKKNIGPDTALTLAVEARRIFEGVSFDNLDFNDAFVTSRPPDDKWMQTLVEAEFQFDETK